MNLTLAQNVLHPSQPRFSEYPNENASLLKIALTSFLTSPIHCFGVLKFRSSLGTHAAISFTVPDPFFQSSAISAQLYVFNGHTPRSDRTDIKVCPRNALTPFSDTTYWAKRECP